MAQTKGVEASLDPSGDVDGVNVQLYDGKSIHMNKQCTRILLHVDQVYV